MTIARLIIISTILLFATVPWFYTEFSQKHVMGFPGWAFYSLCASIFYASVISIFLRRYWSLMEGNSGD